MQLNQEDINSLSDYFIPALFQKKIDKKFEIRIFYINEKLFPMAIFSQNDQLTFIDYRNYNSDRQNRNVPFKLPNEIHNKIIQFVRNKKSNTGSIDLIYSVDDEYIFLEDNPMGQYDWVSKYCNYYIEREIFKQLTNGKNI
ncbi:hypothetical protein [Chryseobacterium indoltheticum]|uniref:hypothetical protein n=1 Tax=Chryseobacterium indoltheticum TaxID=254 RepID=UPI004043341C